jgi:hypothetical protein
MEKSSQFLLLQSKAYVSNFNCFGPINTLTATRKYHSRFHLTKNKYQTFHSSPIIIINSKKNIKIKKGKNTWLKKNTRNKQIIEFFFF